MGVAIKVMLSLEISVVVTSMCNISYSTEYVVSSSNASKYVAADQINHGIMISKEIKNSLKPT